MKFVVLDLEVAGIDRDSTILEFGAIVEDTISKLPFDKIPKFHKIIVNKEIKGDVKALAMNKRLIDILANYPKNELEYEFCYIENLAMSFYKWIRTNYLQMINSSGMYLIETIEIVVAGKNIATFDNDFLKKIPQFSELIKIHRRIIDPAILYVDWFADETLPNTNTCIERAELELFTNHNAIEDAWTVIELLRKKY